MMAFSNPAIGALRQRGVTLIELMVAMVLGLLVAAGIVTVFASTSNSNKAQNQLARLQEEGRYAITRLGTDLRMANGQYCNNTGGVAQPGVSGGLALDHLRSPKVYAVNLINGVGATSDGLADVTTAWGAGSYPVKPTASYSMPSFLFMRGYDCTAAACTPADPSVAGLPAMGLAEGDRVKGADVVTVRYVNPTSGWTVGTVGGSSLTTDPSTAQVQAFTLVKGANEPPITNFRNGDLAMLADCSGAQIFAGTYASATGVFTLSTATTDNFADGYPVAQQPASAPKLFDVNRDFQTVTYYLQVVSVNNDGNAPFTGALRRRVNGGDVSRGGSDEELVRGMERLDFRYGVEDSSGNTSFLSATEVDASTDCPPSEVTPITTTGCLWRGVKSIEVSALMDGQVPLYTLAPSDLQYSYSADNLITTLAAPSAHDIKPSDQGFVDPMLRREFNALIAVRNYNP